MDERSTVYQNYFSMYSTCPVNDGPKSLPASQRETISLLLETRKRMSRFNLELDYHTM